MSVNFERCQVLTFDCYGTLIDWESAILRVLRPILDGRAELNDDTILETYAQLEAAAEAGPYRSYRDVLEEVVLGFGQRFNFVAAPPEISSLPESLGQWQPFPDTVAALRRLKSRFKLAVISNIDDDLFAQTARRLEVPFDFVITAQQARSYKPSHNNFRLALRTIGVAPEKVIHVAQSLFHDIAAARALGLTTVWVNRRGKRMRPGATPRANVRPDLEVPDLKTLAELAVG